MNLLHVLRIMAPVMSKLCLSINLENRIADTAAGHLNVKNIELHFPWTAVEHSLPELVVDYSRPNLVT